MRNKIDAQVAEVQASFQKSLVKVPNKYTVNYSLPEKGLNATELEAELIKLRDLVPFVFSTLHSYQEPLRV